MLYNSLAYALFFVIVLAAYWALRGHRARMALLLVASWVFYAAWYPKYLLLFLLVTALTYVAGALAAASPDRTERQRRLIVTAAIVLDLVMLAFFKYAGFLLQTSAGLASLVGLTWQPPAVHVVLPLGISFYTFQSISYIVDVYRGEVPPIRNPLKLALFKAFFPQLIAGPIVRADELAPQFASRREASPAQVAAGLDLVMLGLFKKVIIADQVAGFADRVFGHPQGLSSITLLLGVYAYAVQIYCDFSGYTDIGRGCAKLLGYELPINFDLPYLSVNIVDFWRRWHISLSRWLRDYLYIPLGGSRRGKLRTYVNLAITMVLGGLWHGASWTFVAWGALHGAALAITRYIHDERGVKGEEPLFGGRAYRALATVATFHLVCLGWVLFRAPTFGVASDVVLGILRFTRLTQVDIGLFGWITLGTMAAVLVGLAVLHLLMGRRSLARRGAPDWLAHPVPRGLAYAGVVILIALFATGGTQQFIYFQF